MPAAAQPDQPNPTPVTNPYPPNWALGTADRMQRYTDVDALDAGNGTWKCGTPLLLTFIADVADASWPDDDYSVDFVLAPTQPGQPGLFATDVTAPIILRRRPARHPESHRRGPQPPNLG
jgi:hypothetical protein